jgi:prophage maintenance system killer protein
VSAEAGAVFARVPRTAEELAELEASYRPFGAAGAWSGIRVDVPRWDRFAHLLSGRRAAAGEQAWADAHDRLLRAAALDSAALDGLFPANPELTATVLAGAVGEPSANDDPVEVVVECHRRALVLAAEAAAGGRGVDPHLMAVLQDVITEAQASYTVTTERGEIIEVELPRRRYKPVSNYLPLPGGGLAAFAPAAMVAAEMERLDGELRSAAFAALHPVVQAAYAHYALTAIHPFADGNGRLARTVASVFLMRAAGLPLIVFAEQWPAYYQALRLATQQGDRQALADFVCVAAMSVMDLAANLVARPAAGSLAADALAALAGLTDAGTVADEAARALSETAGIELREALFSAPRGVRIAITASRTLPAGHTEPGYRYATGQAVVRAAVRAVARRARPGEAPPGDAPPGDAPPGDAPPGGAADLEFVALVSRQPGDLLPVALRETWSGELLEVPLDDAYPLILEPTVVRTRLWVQRLAAEALNRIAPAGADK